MCPIVPMLTWGLLRSNFSFAIYFLLGGWRALNAGHDLLGDVARRFFVSEELHRVIRASLGSGSDVRRVAEHFREGNGRGKDLEAGSRLDAVDAPAPRVQISDHVPHVLFG